MDTGLTMAIATTVIVRTAADPIMDIGAIGLIIAVTSEVFVDITEASGSIAPNGRQIRPKNDKPPALQRAAFL